MNTSAEIRWFWKGDPPAPLKEWFTGTGAAPGRHPVPPGGGVEPHPKPRTDVYLRDPAQAELGLKNRDGKPGVEIKSLVATLTGNVLAPPFSGPVEIWTKSTTNALDLSHFPTTTVKKLRLLRKLDTTTPPPREVPLGPDEQPLTGDRPARAVNVELTRVEIPGAGVWWTFGFEAIGPLHTVADDLRTAAAELARRTPPALSTGRLASYPAWLATV